VKFAFPLSLLSAALALAVPCQGAFARVGIASVVEGEPTGLPPGGGQRVLRVGIDMNADEKVTTKADDRAHLVFLDGTSLTIGPNSEVIIDKYVYTPEKKMGEMALKVQRGTLRFVGGVISKASEVKVETPSASMGIRGGIFTVSVTALGATTANFLFGQSFTITSQGVTQTTTTPGTRIIVTPGSPPTPPTPIPPGTLQNSMASFQGGSFSNPPLGTGGAGPGGNGQGPGGNNVRGPGGRSGGPGTGRSQGENQSGNIGNALSNAGLGKLNSHLLPAVVLANTPSHQQIVTILTTPAGGQLGGSTVGMQLAQGGGPQGLQQGANNQHNQHQGNSRLGDGPQGAGPLSDGGPRERGGSVQGGTPLQGAGGPLQGSGPLQGDDSLQGAGPPFRAPVCYKAPVPCRLIRLSFR
jgi:hypothetical protein